MSIQSEITRITNARDDSLTSVGNKGVTVPSGSTIDDLSGLIDQIDAVSHLPSVPSTKATSIIEVDDYYYAWRDGSGGGDPVLPLQEGVLRKDAEKISTISYDKWVNEDEGITIPSYSTTSKTLISSVDVGTISVNLSSYDYFVIIRCLAYPTYSVSTKGKGRVEYFAAAYLYEIVEIPASTFHAISDTTKYANTRGYSARAAGSEYRSIYWSSDTAVTSYSTYTYTTALSPTAPGISTTKLTLKSPVCSLRGHTTYFTDTYFNAITDIRNQYIIETYRVPRNSGSYDGFGTRQSIFHVINCINNNSMNLT